MSELQRTLPRAEIFGRTAELRAIRETMDGVSDGVSDSSVLLLLGASGVGKSRIAEEALRDAERRGWQIARGRASPVEFGLPDALLQAALQPLLNEVGRERLTLLTRGMIEDLRPIFPLLPGTPATGGVAGERTPEARARACWTLTELLRGMTEGAPLLLVLEDMEWSDASSLEALHFISRQVSGAPLMLLGCLAEDRAAGNRPLEDFVGSLSRSRLLRNLEVPPFTSQEVEAFVANRFETPVERCSAFCRRLWEWTGGNAFFLEETLADLVAGGQLRPSTEGWVGWESPGRFKPASTIEGALLLRIERLSSEARELLELAAVIGISSDAELIEELSGAGSSNFLEQIDILKRGGFLLEEEEGARVALRFTHQLVRDAVNGAMGASRRRALDLRVLEPLRRRAEAGSTGEDALAFHLLHLPPSRWTDEDRVTLVRSGRAALSKGAEAQAADLLEAAINGKGGNDGKQPFDPTLVIDYAKALTLYGRLEKSVEVLRTLLEQMEESGAVADHRIKARRRLAMTYPGGGEPDMAVEVLQALDGEIGESVDPPVRLRVHLVRSAALHQVGRLQEGREEAEHALALAGAEGQPELLARAHRVLTLSYL